MAVEGSAARSGRQTLRSGTVGAQPSCWAPTDFPRRSGSPALRTQLGAFVLDGIPSRRLRMKYQSPDPFPGMATAEEDSPRAMAGAR